MRVPRGELQPRGPATDALADPRQSKEKVTENSDRDYWMKAEEAKNYGMVDEVLKNAPE